MSTVGQREKRTQQRVVTLFREQLGYDYLGDWTDREGNRNLEEEYLRTFLRDKQGCDEALISRALYPSTKRRVTRARACTTATRPSMNCCAMA
jgi:type I restriction enzyme R subunit